MKKRFKHIFLNFILCITAFLLVGMVILSGSGLVCNSGNYGGNIGFMGFMLVLSGIFIAVGFVLCFSKKRKINILSLIFSVSGTVLCMVMLYGICRHAKLAGWNSVFTSEPAESIYQRRILPVLIPSAAAVAKAVSGIVKYGRKNNF